MQDRFWYVLCFLGFVDRTGFEFGLTDICSTGTLLHVLQLQRAVHAHDGQVP
jgi:hypothetical protein